MIFKVVILLDSVWIHPTYIDMAITNKHFKMVSSIYVFFLVFLILNKIWNCSFWYPNPKVLPDLEVATFIFAL